MSAAVSVRCLSSAGDAVVWASIAAQLSQAEDCPRLAWRSSAGPWRFRGLSQLQAGALAFFTRLIATRVQRSRRRYNINWYANTRRYAVADNVKFGLRVEFP